MVCPAQPLDALAVAVTRRIWIENGGGALQGRAVEAAACRLKAEETANSVDKEAWLKLGDDLDKLARERRRDDDVASR
jgi:hypothetical protein